MPRDIPVDWEPLEDAFENNAPHVHSFLHLVTGDVLRIIDGRAEPDAYAKIAADPNCLRIPPVSSREQYRWMVLFIDDMPRGERRDALNAMIGGAGSFRRFKDGLAEDERRKWLSFRSERLRNVMDSWLHEQGLVPVARTAKTVTPSAQAASVLLGLSDADLVAALSAVAATRCLACGAARMSCACRPRKPRAKANGQAVTSGDARG